MNDAPKTINKTSAPLIFADDTIILFAYSNVTDYNNIHMFKANHLSLNLNKTNYIHPTPKRNMSINLKIGFNSNLITNSSYTKFLGITMDCSSS